MNVTLVCVRSLCLVVTAAAVVEQATAQVVKSLENQVLLSTAARLL